MLSESAGPRTTNSAQVDSFPAPRRRRTLAGPLLLFALFGAFYVIPPQGADRIQHLSAIMEARDALREGQFPPRVAPQMAEGRRYPLFQFYGNFPYGLSGALSLLPGVDAYHAWRIVTFLSVTCAGFFAYRCSLSLTRQVWPSIVAGVVFVASPYLSTDFRARFAYTEAVSFCLLPAVLYYSLRAFATPRSRGAIVAGGVAWALVALSHNITYLYASALVGLFFLSCAGMHLRKYVRRMLRVGACYGAGLLLVLWYIAPQLQVLRFIIIAVDNTGATPIGTTTWAPLYALLSPVLTISPTARNTPYLGVQVGWPVLAGVVLATYHVVRFMAARPAGPRPPGIRLSGAAVMVRLLLAFAIAFFIVWSPVDFWRYVPSIFYNLQITYRVLMFVTLWGSLLVGMSLAAFWRRRPEGMPAPAAWACILLVAVASMPFQGWGLERMSPRTLRRLESMPIFGEADRVYGTHPDRIREFQIDVPTGVGLVTVEQIRGQVRLGERTVADLSFPDRRVVQLPVLFYPGLLEVRADGRRVNRFGHVKGLLAIDLERGPHHITVGFVGVEWANVVSGMACLAVLTGAALVALRRLRHVRRWAAGSVASEARPVFPARAAGFGIILLAVPMSLPAAFVHWRREAARRSMGIVLPSSEGFPAAKVMNAFDGDLETEWVTLPGPSAWLVILPRQPRIVSAIELEPRQTELLGGWHKVRVVLYLGDKTAAEQTFDLPDAARQPLQVLELARPTLADGLELRFSDPVTLTRTGDRQVPPEQCYCGYREIRIR